MTRWVPGLVVGGKWLGDEVVGCENLPNEKMQQLCEDKKKDKKDDE